MMPMQPPTTASCIRDTECRKLHELHLFIDIDDLIAARFRAQTSLSTHQSL